MTETLTKTTSLSAPASTYTSVPTTAGRNTSSACLASGMNWLHQLSPAKRAAIRDLHELTPAWNWVLLLYPVLWATAAAAVITWPILPVRLVGYAVIGISIHAMAVLTHEASHFSIFRNRGLDRWVGFLLGAPVLVSGTAYRVHHNDHHRYTRDEKDPDEFLYVTKNRFLNSILFYSWIFVGTPLYLFHVAITSLTRGNRRDRFDIITEYTLLGVMVLGVFALARYFDRFDVIVHCWALPMIVAMAFGNLRSWAEHTMTVPGDPFTRTRTVTSNRFVSFLMCNLNYHLEHHLCPAIPWYNLQRMHALLQPEFKRAGANIYRSYWRFIWDAVRIGVHGEARMSIT